MTTIHSAEIISVGTELLLGETVDTNSSFLANELANRGVDVYWSQRVGDNFPRLVAALQAATGRSDLVLLTGGLGPTADDLTRETHGQGESAIAQLLAPFLHSSNPTVATYAKDDGVHVRVAAKAAGAASARQSAEGFARQVEERLGGLV